MRKVFSIFVFAMLAMLTVVSVSSCGSDNEDEQAPPSKVLGVWVPVTERLEYEDGQTKGTTFTPTSAGYYAIHFLADGTFKYYDYAGVISSGGKSYGKDWGLSQVGKFSLKGNTMYLDGQIDIGSGQCLINDKSMVIVYKEKEEKYTSTTELKWVGNDMSAVPVK